MILIKTGETTLVTFKELFIINMCKIGITTVRPEDGEGSSTERTSTTTDRSTEEEKNSQTEALTFAIEEPSEEELEEISASPQPTSTTTHSTRPSTSRPSTSRPITAIKTRTISTTTRPTSITTEKPARLKITVPVRRRPAKQSRTPRPNRFVLGSTSTAVTSTTLRPVHQTRAPIVLTIAAPTKRPDNSGDFSKTKTVQRITDPLLDSQEIFLDDEPVQQHNGYVVEIDAEGGVYCYDVGIFPYPNDCRKYVQCARLKNKPIQGWVHNCPRNLSFDPVGASCNWGSPLRCHQTS